MMAVFPVKKKINDEVCDIEGKKRDHILDWINGDECDENSDVIFNQEMSSELCEVNVKIGIRFLMGLILICVMIKEVRM